MAAGISRSIRCSTVLLKLQAGSPAIDAASSAPSIAIDFFGDARPQGSGWDMGADEY
jgi:hypothetical protein